MSSLAFRPSAGSALHPSSYEARRDAMQIKGTKSGLLLHLYDRPLAGAVLELRGKLDASPDFYRGSRAVLMLGGESAEAPELAAVIATLEQYGITADGAVCDSDSSAAVARSAGLRLVAASVAAAPELAAVIATLEQYGITADGAVCDSDSSAAVARSAGLRLVAASVAAA